MLSADYIVGLTDGEGSFTAYIRSPVKRHGAKNYRVECHYYIKLRDDDKNLIRKIKQFFGIGRISLQKDNRPNHHDCYRYEVTNLKEITKIIIPFFDKHRLRGNKIRDYLLFKKIIRAVIHKDHQTALGIKRIMKLKSRMHVYWTR